MRNKQTNQELDAYVLEKFKETDNIGLYASINSFKCTLKYKIC